MIISLNHPFMQRLEQGKLTVRSSRVVHQECLDCRRAWVAYERERLSCLHCHKERLSGPTSLSEIREVLEQAQQQVASGVLPADEFDERKGILTQRYLKAAPVFAERANETYEQFSARYLSGDLTDQCLDGLIFCFHCLTELGLHDAAVRAALLIGSGYFQRMQDREIQSLADLADLAAARQWFKHLGQDEWVATVDLLTGLKAGHTVLEHVDDKYLLLQISRDHLNRARQYYATKDLPDIQRRVEKESEWINEQLSHATGAAGQIEAAHINVKAAQINAKSRLDAAEIIGERLGQVATEVGSLASETAKGFSRLSAGLQNGLDLLGWRIDMAGGQVSAAIISGSQNVGSAIASGSQYIGDSTQAAGHAIGASIHHHARETREGFRELGTEVRKSIEAAGDKAAGAMSGLGNTVAVGMVGGAALHATLLNGTLERVADGISSQLHAGTENLKCLQSPSSVSQPLTSSEFRDLLVQRGLGEVNQRIQPYGFELGRTR